MNGPALPDRTDPPPTFDSGALSRRFRATAFWRALPSGMRRRWWLFRPFDLIARHWPVFRKPRGVLVVRMDGIGDMVLFRRALDHYADAFGVDQSEITVLGCDSWGRLADRVFAGYRVVTIDEHAFARNPFYRFKVALGVRRMAPAVTICDSYMRRALMADSLVWLSAAPETVVSAPFVSERTRPEFTYYLSQVGRIIDTGPYPTHEIIRHYRFVSAIAGKTIQPEAPRIAWRDQPPPVAAGAPYAVLNPGSNEPGRRWPLAGYVAVARRLLKRGYRVILVGQADTWGDRQGIAGIVDDANVIDLTGRTDLPQLMDLIKHAALMVTNDTGPAHLGVALGCPTVIIVGGGHFGSFVPYPAAVAPANVRFVHQRMECYHCFWRCHKRANAYQVFPCVSAIGEETVWRECEALLAAGAETTAGKAAGKTASAGRR